MLSHPVPINIKSSKKKLTNILQNYYLYNFDEAFDKNEENEKQIIICLLQIKINRMHNLHLAIFI